jgi:hypothetical protein
MADLHAAPLSGKYLAWQSGPFLLFGAIGNREVGRITPWKIDLRDADWEDLCVLRDLKNDLIGEPAARQE